MNYKNRKKRNNEEEQKVQTSSNNGSWGYSPDALAALESGQYGKLTGRKAKYNTSAEQTQQAKELPVLAELKPSSQTQNKIGNNDTTIIDPVRARKKYAERNAGPSTKYNTAIQTTSPNINPNRDKTYDKDFDEFYDWRYAKQDVRDYDPATDTETEHWRNVKKDLMKKNGWTEAQFDEKFNEYYDERRQKESDEEVAGWTKFAEDHPYLASVGQTIMNPGTWMEGAVTVAEGALSPFLSEETKQKYMPTDANDYRFEHTRVRDAVKEAARDKIGGGMLYDMGVGALDLPAQWWGMALNNAASTQRRKLANGVDRDKAAQTGALSGVISAITNKIGLEKAVGAGEGAKTAWQAIKNGALIEGAENVIEDRLNRIADVALNWKKSDIAQIYQNYVAQGMSPIKAIAYTAKDVGVEDLTSFGSGAFMGGTIQGLNNLPRLSADAIDRFQFNKTPNQDIQNIVDGKVPEVTSEADVQKAAQAQEQAAAEIERLAEQIPETQAESAPEGIQVYRGYNRSENPLEGNLAKQRSIYDVLGRENPNDVDMLPLEYYTDSEEDATNYANMDKQLYDQMRQKGMGDDAYETLTGRKPDFNGRVESHTINPQNVLDLSELGEITSVDAIYDYLSKVTGKTPSEIDDILRLGSIEYDDVGNRIDIPAFSVLRNFDNNEGAVGSRFVDFMRDNGYDAVKYKESGANHYAVLNDNGSRANAPIEPTTEAPNRTMNESAGANDVIARRTEQVPKMQPTPEPETENVPKLEPEIKPLQGEELAKAKEQVKSIDLRIKELEGKKKFDLENKKNYHAGKLKKAIEKQHKEYNKEIAALKKQKTAINRQIKGKAEPVTERMKRENKSLYESIFGGPSKGAQENVYNKINAAVQMAGDTPEAKELANGMKKAIRDFINTGDFEHIREALELSIELDKKAREGGRLYYTNKHSYEYKDVFNRIDENGNEVESDLFNSIEPYIDNLRQYIYDINGIGAEPESEAPTQEAPVQPVNNVQADNGGNNVPPEGNIPPSQPPRTDIMEQSDVGQNTAVNSGVYTREQLDNDPVIHELNSYAKANNDLTYNQAMDDVVSDGATLLDEYSSGRRAITDDIDVDRSMILLTDLTRRIKAGETGLEAQKNLLFSRLRKAGTKYGQTIQAFAKWNQTPEGAIINAEAIHKAPVEKWKENNQTKVQANSRIAKALERMGYDGSMEKTREPLTRDQIREGVIKAIEKEYGSIEGIFNDEDIEFLTDLAENKKIPIWQITDEIEHRLNHGVWYEITEDTPEPAQKGNQKLQNALNSLLEREPEAEKAPLSFDELKKQIRATLDKEAASAGISRLYTDEGGFTDADVDYLAHMIQNGATKAELAEALDTKLATGTFGISADTQAKVNQLFEYADQFDPNSKEAVEAMSAAYKLLADEVVGEFTPFEKFDAWRYLAMLGNPKTMLRNYIGNKIFGAVTGASNNFSALLEAGTDKLVRKITKGQKGIQRTKAVLNPANDRGLIKAAANDADAHRYKQINGTKYEKGVKDAIKSQKSVFNSRWAQIYESLTDRGISDYSAVKRKYSTSLAGWMKANGLDESAFDADNLYRQLQKESQFRVLTDAEKAQMESYKQVADKLEKARDYALKQAEYATFHEDNAVAKMLTKWSSEARKSNSGVMRTIGYMGEGLVPFKKTPANVLRSGLEYSPLNVINSIRETGKFIIENTGHRKADLADTYTKTNKLTGRETTVNRSLAADVLDSSSKTLTGTMLTGLGYYLFNKGILHSSDEGEKYQDQLEGKQNFSIIINGKSYTIDWASPAAMPLLMGAELCKIWQKSGQDDAKFYENADEIIGAVGSLLDPVFETSMLQGIQNTAESVAHEITYGNSAASKGLGVLGAIAGNTLTNYLTQGIPTILGQVARTVDPTRRTTDTASDGFLGSVERVARKQMNKIPWLSMLNQPYLDAYARTQSNSPFNNPVGNLAYQMLSPGYLTDVNETAADTSARAAFNGLDEKGKPIKDENVFPTWKSTVRINGEKLTPEQMAVYRDTSGKAQYEIRSALANEDWFKALSPAQQTDILKKVNTVIDKVGKSNFAEQTGTEYEKYSEGGLPNLLDYFKGSAVKNEVEQQTGLKGTTNASKAIVEQIEQGNEEAANQMIDAATAITNAGLTKPGPTATYYAAREVDPNLTPDDFIMLYKDIDGADGSSPNQGIKVPEIIAYLNSTNYTKDEGVQIWKMFKPANAKKVPELVKQDNGTYIWK